MIHYIHYYGELMWIVEIANDEFNGQWCQLLIHQWFMLVKGLAHGHYVLVVAGAVTETTIHGQAGTKRQWAMANHDQEVVII